MKPDPIHKRSAFSAWVGYWVWAIPAVAIDAVTIAAILAGALAVGVFGLVRALVRPSIHVEAARAKKRADEGQRDCAGGQ